MKDFKNDLTEGSVTKKLVAFSIPFFLSNFIQALYSVIDILMVGWFSNTSGISGVTIGSQVTWLINCLISGITMGGTVLIAQYMGAKKEKDLKETISTMLTIFALAAIIITFIAFIFSVPVLRLINTPPEAFNQAKAFVHISISGTVFIFGYNMLSAILRGMGDSKNPLKFVTIACINNIVLDFIFLGIFKLGAGGAALATVISQALSMLLAIIYLRKNNFIFDFRLKSFKINKNKAKLLLKIGLPTSFQDTAVNLSFIFITAIVNGFGVSASAAVGIAGKFDSFAMLPASAMAMAIASMTAQNIGAKLYDRAKKILKTGIIIALSIALLFFIWIQVFPESVVRLFTNDISVIQAGKAYMLAFSYDFLMVSFVFCMDGFFNGCGHSNFSLFNGLISTLLLRVPLAYLLGKILLPGLFGVGLAAPLASFCSLILGIIYIKSGRWKKTRVEI